MTNQEIFDTYASSAISGVGNYVAQQVLAGFEVQDNELGLAAAAVLKLAKAVYDMRSEYAPVDAP